MIDKSTSTNVNGGSLFDTNPIIAGVSTSTLENRKETALEHSDNTPESPIVQRVKCIEKPPRKIVEIRIFFDDNTYEVFKGDI